METRADTLSSRFGGQWAFLSSPPQHGHSRSVPPSSSYLYSDRSSVSPLPTGLHFYHLNASRSSLPRNVHTPSIGGHSSTTIPSQPVLIREHHDDASAHLHTDAPENLPAVPRPPRRRTTMNKQYELPPIEEFSIRGILAAIQEDIEDDVNAISEILGRSRLALADQHESHLPPQGEIRASSHTLQAVEEASSSNERLAAEADDVLIAREDASLIEGSHTGSAAYGLLERLQAVPHTRRMRSESAVYSTLPPMISAPSPSSPNIPAERLSPPGEVVSSGLPTLPRALHRLLVDRERDGREFEPRSSTAVVSETFLSAGANGRMMSDPPVVSESGRQYPLYSYDYSDIFERGVPPSSSTTLMTFRQRLQSLLSMGDLQILSTWMQGPRPGQGHGTMSAAESHLRDILDRQQPETIIIQAENLRPIEHDGYE